MTTTTITGLAFGNTPTGTEVLPVDQVQGGSTVTAKLTLNQVLALITLAGLGGTTLAAVEAAIDGEYMASALSPITDNPVINSQIRSPAEISASVTPTNYGYLPGNVLRYGADPTGVADSAPAFTKAFAVKGAVTAVGTFLLNSSVTIDISTTCLQGPCSLVSGLAANAGALLRVIGSSGPDQNITFGLDQVWFQGQHLTGVQALVFNSTGSDGGNVSINRTSFTAFATGAWIETNAFEVEFSRCIFSNCGADNAALYVEFSGSERNSCVQCEFFNNTECVRQSSGGQLFMDNCSFDYSNRVVVCNSGEVFMHHCYIESNLDTDYWLNATGSNPASLILFDHGMIAQVGAKTAYNDAYSNASVGQGGGVFIRNSKLYVSSTNSVLHPFIGGAGNSGMSQNIVEGFASDYTAWGGASAYSNLISNSTFANGSGGLGGYTYGSTGSGGNPTTSADTLLLQSAVSGQDQYCYWTLNAVPGENIGVTCQMKANSTSASATLGIHAYGADGTLIGSSTKAAGYNEFGSGSPLPTSSYQTVHAVFLNLPSGTATVRVQVDTDGGTSSANIVSVQTLTASKY